MAVCDLHTHSNASDGTALPAELIAGAKAAGLSAVALCDHNTVAGLPAFLAAAADSGVEAVPGIEISTEWQEKELHIVGLFVQPRHYAPLTALLEEVLQRKERSNLALVEALAKDGILLDYAAIKASTPGGQVNRAVLGTALMEAGYADSVQDAFSRYLSVKRGYYCPPQRLQALEVIAFLGKLGVVSVLAHPFLSLDEPQLRTFLPLAAAAGLDGMEVHYARHTPEQTELARQLADAHGLLHSGGSDYHGARKPDISIGTGTGDLRVASQLLEALRSRAREKQTDF